MSSGSGSGGGGGQKWIAYLGAIASLVTIIGFLYSFGVLQLPLPTLGPTSITRSTVSPSSAPATLSSPTIPAGSVDPASQVLAAYDAFCTALRTHQLQTAFNGLTPGYQHNVGSPSNLPDAVGGTFGPNTEQAQDCSRFFPVAMDANGQRGVELGNVTVTDSQFGQHTIARHFEFILTSGSWLINNIYAQ